MAKVSLPPIDIEHGLKDELRGYEKFGKTRQTAAVTADTTETEAWKEFTSQTGGSQSRQVVLPPSNEIAAQPWASNGIHRPNSKTAHISVKTTMSRNLLLALAGTMPEASVWVSSQNNGIRFTDACLRGTGQVFLINNPVTGAIILLGIACASWYMLVLGIVGLVASTGTAMLLGFDKGSISAGLFGYNGILTGMAMALFHFGSKDNPSLEPQIVLPIILMGGVSTLLTSSLGKVTVSLFGMPPFTFPFQMATWAWLLGAQSSFSYFPLEFPAPGLAEVAQVANTTMVHYDTESILQAPFMGVSEVFLLSNLATGILMLVGIFVSSPIAALFAFLGSATGMLTAMALGVSGPPIYMGLAGFNSCLTAVCVGGMFFVLSWRCVAMRCDAMR
jgi:urea transporter